MTDAPDSASRVHKLAVPHHVTMRAERRANAMGDGHHYVVTGYYREGEAAFPEQTVSGEVAATASDAIRAQLERFRERGW